MKTPELDAPSRAVPLCQCLCWKMSLCDVVTSWHDVVWHCDVIKVNASTKFGSVHQTVQTLECSQTDTHTQTGPIPYPRLLMREGMKDKCTWQHSLKVNFIPKKGLAGPPPPMLLLVWEMITVLRDLFAWHSLSIICNSSYKLVWHPTDTSINYDNFRQRLWQKSRLVYISESNNFWLAWYHQGKVK